MGCHTGDRSDPDLVSMVSSIIEVVPVRAVVCTTVNGSLPRRLRERQPGIRLIVASHDGGIRASLERDGFEVVAVPTQVADKYRQARLAAASALAACTIEEGELVLCVVGHGTSLGGGDLVAVTTLDDSSQLQGLGDLVTLPGEVMPAVFEAVVEVATRIGLVAQRGKRIGALFMIGDADRVMQGSHQLVLNPLRGHEAGERTITNPRMHDTLVELAKLDGAFVLDGGGVIRAGGVYLAAADTDVEVPSGLGTRHLTAAAVTARTTAVGVVVSATDGAVRVYVDGRMVLLRHTDPAID